jgi:hypothetical protein
MVVQNTAHATVEQTKMLKHWSIIGKHERPKKNVLKMTME